MTTPQIMLRYNTVANQWETETSMDADMANQEETETSTDADTI